MSLTPTLPRILSGRAPAVAMASIRDFDVRGGSNGLAARGFEQMYESATQDVLHGTGRETFEAIQFLKKSDPARYQPAPGADYPRGRYGDSLKQVAQLVKADVGVEVAFTDVGGWDHHAAEGGVQMQLAARLREFGEALAAFRRNLGDRMQDVVVVTMTEFGRTARRTATAERTTATPASRSSSAAAWRAGSGRWPGLSRTSSTRDATWPSRRTSGTSWRGAGAPPRRGRLSPSFQATRRGPGASRA